MVNSGLLADYFIETAKQTFEFNRDQSEIKDMIQSMKSLTRDEKIIRLFDRGIKQAELTRFFGVSKQYVSKLLKKSTESQPKVNQKRGFVT